MAALTRQAIDQVVRDMNDFYQPDNDACGARCLTWKRARGARRCPATPSA